MNKYYLLLILLLLNTPVYADEIICPEQSIKVEKDKRIPEKHFSSGYAINAIQTIAMNNEKLLNGEITLDELKQDKGYILSQPNNFKIFCK